MIASSKGYLLPDYLLFVCVHIIAEVSESRYLDCNSEDDESAHTYRINTGMTCSSTLASAAAISSGLSATTSSPVVPPSQVSDNNRSHRKPKTKLVEFDVRQQRESASRTLVISIMLRAAFGGMAGDVIMLKKYSSIWFNRFFRDLSRCTEMGSPERHLNLTPALRLSPTGSRECSPDPYLVTSLCTPSPSPSFCSPPGINNRAILVDFSTDAATSYGLLMEVYIHPHWLKSLINSGSHWAQRCVHSFSPPSSQVVMAPQHSSSAFNVLSDSIVTSLRDVSNTCPSLYSLPVPTPAAVSATVHSMHTHLKEHLILRTHDLLSEGIDFHCDGEIVRAVRDRCNTCHRSISDCCMPSITSNISYIFAVIC